LKPSDPNKIKRAKRLDLEFVRLAKGEARRRRFQPWSRYVSMSPCTAAEYRDGSHFTNDGAQHIFDTMLRREIRDFIK
jgi:hypothetical protein